MVKYTNEKLGFEFMHDENIYLIEETDNKVSFGYMSPIITISSQLTDYKSYKPCDANMQTLPCLEEGKKWGQAEDINEASPQQAAGYHKEGHCL